MRKRKKGGRLGRTYGARRGLLRGLLRSLVLHGTIETSSPRAKILRGFVDHLVTIVKKGTIASRRQAIAVLAGDEATVVKLFEKIPTFGTRTSGFTRSTPLASRRGDDSLRVRMEWTDKEKKVEKALPAGRQVARVAKVAKVEKRAEKKT